MIRKLAPALAAPILLIASSCASPADDTAIEVRTGEAATQALRAAPDAVTDAGTVSMEMVTAMTVEGQAIEMVASGVMDANAQRMAMEVDMATMLRDLAEQTGEAISDGLDGPMRVVADGTTLYVQMPFASLLGAPSGWVSVDLDEHGIAADQLGAGAYDLRGTLEALRGTSGEPEVIGADDVRGVETTHYRARIDLAEAIAAAPDSARAALEQMGDAGDLAGVELVVDVWIDDEGLPRRQQMDMGAMLGSLGLTGASASVMIEYFDYGEPVDIRVPSPDEVTPVTDLMDAFGGGQGS